jgi:hypothetical protein
MLRLALAPDSDPYRRDVDRLTLTFTNTTGQPIVFDVYEGEIPYTVELKIDEIPDIVYGSVSDGEPPHENVAIAPGESREFHPLASATSMRLWAPAGKPHFIPDGNIWHVRATWQGHTSNTVAMRLN